MKSTFPAWLRRQVPDLAREDDNPVYEAFRIRRRAWAKRKPFLRGIPTHAQRLLAMILSIVLYFVLLGVLPLQGKMLVVFGYAAFAIGRSWHRKRSGLATCSLASDCFQINVVHPQLAKDLWLCGVKGSDVVEAIFLEQFEAMWLGISILLMSPVVAGYVLLYWYGHPFSPVGLILQIALLWLAWALFRGMTYAVVSSVANSYVAPRLKGWGAASWSERMSAYGDIASSMVLVGIGVVVAAVLVCLIVCVLFVPVSPDDGPIQAFLKVYDVELLATGAVIAVAGVLLRRRTRWSVKNADTLMRLRLAGDACFEEYMRRVVLEGK